MIQKEINPGEANNCRQRPNKKRINELSVYWEPRLDTHLASTLRQIVLKFRKKKNLQKFGRELVKGAPSKVWT